MAENKKSFLLYCDLIHTVSKLPNDIAGELFKHILSYVNDENPETDNLLIQVSFEPIKQQLKRDLLKYESIREKNRNNALKRWHTSASNGNGSDAKNADNDTVTDNDTDNDTVIIKKEKRFNFRKALIDGGFDKNLVDDWLKVRKTKKATNTNTALVNFMNECSKTDIKDYNEIIKLCVVKSWAGFKSSWLEKEKSSEKKETINRQSEQTIKKNASDWLPPQ